MFLWVLLNFVILIIYNIFIYIGNKSNYFDIVFKRPTSDRILAHFIILMFGIPIVIVLFIYIIIIEILEIMETTGIISLSLWCIPYLMYMIPNLLIRLFLFPFFKLFRSNVSLFPNNWYKIDLFDDNN